MQLAFRGPRPDRAPGDQIRYVLGGEQIEKLRPGRQPHFIDIEKKLARQPQPLVYLETAIQPRVIDIPLPTHGRTRLFEINAHDDFKIGDKLAAQAPEQSRILLRRGRIMDRAWADNDKQAIIRAMKKTMYGLSSKSD